MAKSGNIEIIASLLSQGFEVDSKDREGVTPLIHEAESSKEVTFQMLIQKGANTSLKDNKGSSVLHRLQEVEIHPLSTNCYYLVLK